MKCLPPTSSSCPTLTCKHFGNGELAKAYTTQKYDYSHQLIHRSSDLKLPPRDILLSADALPIFYVSESSPYPLRRQLAQRLKRPSRTCSPCPHLFTAVSWIRWCFIHSACGFYLRSLLSSSHSALPQPCSPLSWVSVGTPCKTQAMQSRPTMAAGDRLS